MEEQLQEQILFDRVLEEENVKRLGEKCIVKVGLRVDGANDVHLNLTTKGNAHFGFCVIVSDMSSLSATECKALRDVFTLGERGEEMDEPRFLQYVEKLDSRFAGAKTRHVKDHLYCVIAPGKKAGPEVASADAVRQTSLLIGPRVRFTLQTRAASFLIEVEVANLKLLSVPECVALKDTFAISGPGTIVTEASFLKLAKFFRSKFHLASFSRISGGEYDGSPVCLIKPTLSTMEVLLARALQEAIRAVPVAPTGRVDTIDVVPLLRGAQKLGEGAFGTVYRATWNGTDVAVKVLKPTAEKSELENEVSQLSQCSHPHVVLITGYCENPTAIVTEYLPLGSLQRVKEIFKSQKGLPVSLLCQFAHDISKGMVYLHSKDILHRDLKSPNVLVGEALKLKLADFGLSRTKAHLPAAGAEGVTTADATMMNTTPAGTITHMAPECFFGKFSPKSDVYAFAMTLWELATCEWPFASLPPMPLPVLVLRIQTGLRPPLPPSNPKITEVISTCWFAERRDRPPFAQLQERFAGLASVYPVPVEEEQRVVRLLRSK